MHHRDNLTTINYITSNRTIPLQQPQSSFHTETMYIHSTYYHYMYNNSYHNRINNINIILKSHNRINNINIILNNITQQHRNYHQHHIRQHQNHHSIHRQHNINNQA